MVGRQIIVHRVIDLVFLPLLGGHFRMTMIAFTRMRVVVVAFLLISFSAFGLVLFFVVRTDVMDQRV